MSTKRHGIITKYHINCSTKADNISTHGPLHLAQAHHVWGHNGNGFCEAQARVRQVSARDGP